VEAKTARRLDSRIAFADPGNFRSFEAMLNVAEEGRRCAKLADATPATSGPSTRGR
jgi:hypothetical protein